MKKYWQTDDTRAKGGFWMALDGEEEHEGTFITWIINSFKTSYFRKNAAKPARIQLRCHHPKTEPDFWKFYLEFYRGDKQVDRYRITHECYDLMAGDKPKDELPGLELITWAEHIPEPKPKKEKPVKKVVEKPKQEEPPKEQASLIDTILNDDDDDLPAIFKFD